MKARVAGAGHDLCVTADNGRIMHQGLFWCVIATQCLCGAYFTWEILASVAGLPSLPLRWQAREMVELGASLGLIVGAGLAVHLVTTARHAKARADRAHKLTSGAFAQTVDDYFARLSLTEAERDVAWLVLKGMTMAEIAEIRQTRPGTVKAQCTAVYRKAGVGSKSQLFSQVVEDLLL